MWMFAESPARFYTIVVENAERSPVDVVRIEVVREAERVVRLEPAMVEEGTLVRALDQKTPRQIRLHGPMMPLARILRLESSCAKLSILAIVGRPRLAETGK
jgi:hypothetical protein